MSDTPYVVARPSRISPKEARDARARVLAFAFDLYAKREAAPESHPNDAEDFRMRKREEADM
jgi:hypothetical protein